ncbi:MAG: zinc-dependent metalloprotease [Chloroflexota bacterium]
MANYRTIGKGLLIGAAALSLWAISRRSTGRPPKLINWERVRSMALSMSRSDELGPTASRTEMGWQYRQWVRRSEESISRYLGKTLPRALEAVYVFDRTDWIDANLSSFQDMFEPFEKLNDRMLGDCSVGMRLVGSFNQLLLTSQLGALMGYLSARVLGQYDAVLLGKEPIEGGKLYFVEPNISMLQERMGFKPDEFRLWIALHEATHAFEFEAHPWLRGYMNSLLTRYLDAVGDDLSRMQGENGGLGQLVQRIAGNVVKGGHFMEWMMTARQRALFQELQALMCLVEGYSNHVMQAVGQDLCSSYHWMKERFEERNKNKTAAEQWFTRLTGLDAKMEQYVLGERFVNEVVRQKGIDFMNKAWESPAMLPNMDEIRQPDRWIQRVSRLAS